ncbi:cation transport ATPase [Ostreiculturibacter nitratireducens]|uniref:cation transport ATPase n=1 Tax=Ostreiculturibacter nitratireducens TaxID=3075226 RepID=UPI0031B5D83F
MSTWISKAAFALLAPAILSACVAGGTGSAPTQVAVLGSSVTVAGPRGYCVDSTASRDGAESAFVLLGSCASLAGTPFAPAPKAPAILTASVLAEGAELVAETAPLAAFFRSASGRAALSRSGNAETVEVLETFEADGVMFLRVRDISESGTQGQPVEPEYWRAVLALNGRLVTLSALGHQARPLSAGDKRAAIDAFLARMLAANPTRTAEAPEAAAPPPAN